MTDISFHTHETGIALIGLASLIAYLALLCLLRDRFDNDWIPVAGIIALPLVVGIWLL